MTEVHIEPCPFCGSKCERAGSSDHRQWAFCVDDDCLYGGPYEDDEAFEKHNALARKMHELSDACARITELEQTWSAAMAQNARHMDRIAELEAEVARLRAALAAREEG